MDVPPPSESGWLRTLSPVGRRPPAGSSLAPAPPARGPLGHLRAVRRDPLAFFLEMRARGGDVVRLQAGPLLAHLLSDPEHVRIVLQERHRHFGKGTRGYKFLRLLLGQGLVTSDGDHWLSQRRLAQPAFHRERIESFGARMASAVEALSDRWEALGPGAVVDVQREMMELTLRVVSETLLGTDVGPSIPSIARSLAWLLEDLNARVLAPWSLPMEVPTARNRNFRSHVAALDRTVYSIIAERRRSGRTDDLLGLLMNARDAETGRRMDDRQLRDEIMTMFIAGHETTATALTWTFHLLSAHPTVERELHEEVDAVIDGRSASIADLPRLGHTERVLQEAMRLFPPAWMIERTPREDEVIDGWFLPAGSTVLISPWVIHRHPALWPRPGSFEPSRFATEHDAERPRFAYLPFGGGPRQCIGNRFAMVEAQIVLATLARRWRLVALDRPVTPQPLVTLRVREGLPMRLEAR